MIKKVYTSIIDSPLGLINLGASEKGICLLEFGNEKRIQNHYTQFNKHWDVELINKKSNLIEEAEKQLLSYFNKELVDFDLPQDIVGTAFQLSVWEELLNIKYGTTRSYKQQAIALGDIKAIRAVATANGQNRISIIIPCHRVIGTDGSLTGYGGELWRKQKLLELENNQPKLF